MTTPAPESTQTKQCSGCCGQPHYDWKRYTMDAVATRYGILDNNAAGITVGILAWGAVGKVNVDIAAVIRDIQRLKGDSSINPNFQFTFFGGQTNNHTNSQELPMDCTIMGYFCCDADAIQVYVATPETAHEAIEQARKDGCYVTTCSYGLHSQVKSTIESKVEPALQQASEAGMVCCFAAGDTGAASGTAAGFSGGTTYPAGIPYATSVGGTYVDSDNLIERVWWNFAPADSSGSRCWWGSGGGISQRYEIPPFQANVNPPPTSVFNGSTGRGVPDVACMAQGLEGFTGTSAATPTFASLVASVCAGLEAQGFDGRLFLFNELIYAPLPSYEGKLFTKITSGKNTPPSCCSEFPQTGYVASHTQWDACTGLGTPQGSEIYAMFLEIAETTAGES